MPRPGWLKRQFEKVALERLGWPSWMRGDSAEKPIPALQEDDLLGRWTCAGCPCAAYRSAKGAFVLVNERGERSGGRVKDGVLFADHWRNWESVAQGKIGPSRIEWSNGTAWERPVRPALTSAEARGFDACGMGLW